MTINDIAVVRTGLVTARKKKTVPVTATEQSEDDE